QRASGSNLSRYQSRFVSIGQPAARRQFGLIPNDPARRIARQRRETISICFNLSNDNRYPYTLY
ncbi:MAG: hypothetical protein ACREUY_07565, partial [Burkholderiales bacterium]